jgi:hypothetical protein
LFSGGAPNKKLRLLDFEVVTLILPPVVTTFKLRMCNPIAVTNQSTGHEFRKGHGIGKDEGLGRKRSWEGHGFSRAAHAKKLRALQFAEKLGLLGATVEERPFRAA